MLSIWHDVIDRIPLQMDAISKGDEHCEKLLGSFRSRTDQLIPSAVRKAEERLVTPAPAIDFGIGFGSVVLSVSWRLSAD
jgi:hypothetical protein